MERRKPLARGKGLRRGKPLEPGKPLARGKPLERSGPLARRAELRATPTARKPAGPRPAREGQLGDVEWRRLVIGRAGGWCEARLEGCTGTATEAHHRYRPGRPNLPANGVALCSTCHTGSPAAVHRNEAWSVAVGLLVASSTGPPAERWVRPEILPDRVSHPARREL